MKQPQLSLAHLLGDAGTPMLDRYQALLDEDQALRTKEYDGPPPKQRGSRHVRRNSCRDCNTPFCCNQRVTLDFAEALALYRHAARHARKELGIALSRKDLPDDNHDFFRRRVACAFLNRGKCTVYDARPLACRSHYMAGPPVQCRDQLAPSSTYAMSPDNALITELGELGEELRWELRATEIEEPQEMSALLRVVHELAQRASPTGGQPPPPQP